MRAFSYERPADAAAAVDAVGHDGAMFLGGGTNLVDLMKLGVASPERLVDVAHLPGAGDVLERDDGGLRIGAAVPNADLAVHPLVLERYPVLSQALLAGASGQLRNLATTGGNLLQRTRCPYFQDVSKPCNKRSSGSGCPARAGEHHNLAILGHSEACVATHPSDMAVGLTALDAEVHVTGPDGERAIGMPGFHRLPGDEPQRDTVLAPGELITAVELGPLDVARRSSYRKVRERASYAFAVVSVAVALELRDGTVQDVRIAFGGVAHAPWRAERGEAALRGGPATEDAFAAAAREELARARPLRDNAYKVPIAERILTRTLTELTEDA